MALIAKSSDEEREYPDTGVHVAVCAFVEDIGVHHSDLYNKDIHQIVVGWELAQKRSDGKPFVVSKRYTFSFGKKANLRIDVEAWRGTSFTDAEAEEGVDIEKLIGVNCQLNLVKTEKGSIKISSIMPLAKGMQKITASGEGAPEWIAEERKKAITPEPETAKEEEPEAQGDIPF